MPAVDPAPDEPRCARGDWCASRTSERGHDGKYRPVAASAYQTFCLPDRAIIADSILELPGYYPQLAEALSDNPTVETIVRVPFGPSVLIRLDIDTLMRVTAEAIAGWH